jgi:hypothetical protein
MIRSPTDIHPDRPLIPLDSESQIPSVDRYFHLFFEEWKTFSISLPVVFHIYLLAIGSIVVYNAENSSGVLILECSTDVIVQKI